MADIHVARRRLGDLRTHLEAIVKRDPEQEVQGIALPVLDAVIVDARSHFPDDPVVAAVADIISADTVGAAEPIRAVDALLVVNQLYATVVANTGPTIA